MAQTSKESKEQVSAKLELELYRRFAEYRDLHGLNDTDAVKQLLSRALYETALLEEIKCQHEITRRECERLTAFVAGNLARPKPLPGEAIRDSIAQIAARNEQPGAAKPPTTGA